MRRIGLILIMCMFAISARIHRLNLHQQRMDAMEALNLLRSAEVALDIPIAGNMSWGDLINEE